MPEPDIFDRYRLFIFDADDTLRRTTVAGKPCPHAPDEWDLMPGVQEILSQVSWNQAHGPLLGIASNQDQVGYGDLSLMTARQLLRDLARRATRVVPPEPALQLCPHPLELDCVCRKPKPGMLIAIMRHYGIAPRDTVFVGNHPVDREAAMQAGTSFWWSTDFFDQTA